MLYAMSDIHGDLHALEGALKNVDLSGNDQLVLLGDYIDYGPKSREVLRAIYGLQQKRGPEKVVVLRGNHEDAFLEWLDTYSDPPAGGEEDLEGLFPWGEWLEVDPGFGTFQSLIGPERWACFQRSLPYLSDEVRNIKAARMVLEENRELITWLRALPCCFETDRQIFARAGVDGKTGYPRSWATPEHVSRGGLPPSGEPFDKDVIASHAGTNPLAGDQKHRGWKCYCIGGVRRGGRLNILAWDEKNEVYVQWNNGWRKKILSR